MCIRDRNINTGNVHISVENILKIIFLRQGEEMEYNIIWKIRLPRILMAAILGGGLSLSGFLLQTFFENPIAGPFVPVSYTHLLHKEIRESARIHLTF